jgi:small GTP-binding protein
MHPLEQYSLKVILVGGTGVGKTNLMNAYFRHPLNPQTLPTVAPSSCTATIRVAEFQVELQIWDTAGQERFQSISRMFYREANIAFVCFDFARIDTVDSWVESVRMEAPDCAIFLVTTKSDLLSPDEMGRAMALGEEKRRDLNAFIHVLTSAHTGDGVEPLFIEAAKMATKIYRSNEPVLEIGHKTEDQGKCC